MLAAYCSTNENSSNCAKLLGTATPKHEGGLISDNPNLISSTPLGSGLDSCSFFSEPSDDTIMAFGERTEVAGSIALECGVETAGSIAFAGGSEICGSVASAGGFSGGSCSAGGGCSYSC